MIGNPHILLSRSAQPNTDPRFNEPTVGKVLLKMRGMFVEDYMYWICVIALFAFSILFNVFFIVALTYLTRKPGFYYLLTSLLKSSFCSDELILTFVAFGDSKSVIPDENAKTKKNIASDGSSTSAAPAVAGLISQLARLLLLNLWSLNIWFFES